MQPHRRRKKRPNYGIRTVEVDRGVNGFGFTISGQQPCILSCIVTNSPADQAGLKAGDFLISVNGLSVSKVTHDAVVQIIGNSIGPIKMSIAEYYYSDSSDDEPLEHFVARSKPRYPYRPKLHRTHKHTVVAGDNPQKQSTHLKPPVDEKMLKHQNNVNNSRVYCVDYCDFTNKQMSSTYDATKKLPTVSIERPKLVYSGYKAFVGYLGTIEMPNQLRPATRMHTVYSCIRRFRQEKRSPTTVVMMVMPSCVTLTNSDDLTLATYPANRVVYINSSSEKDSCYFGLVTTTVIEHTTQDQNTMPTSTPYDVQITQRTGHTNRTWNCADQVPIGNYGPDHHVQSGIEQWKGVNDTDVDVSHSCHVFVTDSKLCDHSVHSSKAVAFNIKCTQDVVSGTCLEFPKTSEYIVNLVQKMYSLPLNTPSPSKPPANMDEGAACAKIPEAINLNEQLVANSPQPSASSNSDSGIGFRDDCGMVSDRILVVDFPAQPPLPMVTSSTHRPIAIDGSSIALDSLVKISNIQSTKSGLQKLRARCSNPQCKSEIILSENSIYDHYVENGREAIINVSFDVANPDNNPKMKNKNYMNISELQADKHEVNKEDSDLHGSCMLQTCSNISPAKQDEECLLHASLNSNANEVLDDKRGLARSKSSDNVSDTGSLSIFKTPICKSKFGTVKDNDRLRGDGGRQVTSKITNRASKTNLSHEELNVSSAGDKSMGYCSLQELWSLSNKGLQLSAVSEPDVRLKEYIDDDCASFGNENMDSNSKLENSNLNDPGAASNWASAFEKLLEDAKGCEAFTEFLKKEFSAENIHFWTSCENYRKLESMVERTRLAEVIYDKHLCKGAAEPVNVDAQARTITEEALRKADPNLFLHAQKQIFNLMKFDSYPRFLKSELYNGCLMNDTLNDEQTPTPKTSANKLKKSLSNAEDRRRKSLLPWHRKNRSKSKDRGEMEYSHQVQQPSNTISTPIGVKNVEENEKEIYSSRSSLTSWDIVMNFSQDEAKCVGVNPNCLNKNNFCRVILSDGATTVVQIRQDETVREMANRLLDKRGLAYSNYEVFVTNKSKPIDLNKKSVDLAGQEVIIEHRVVFKLDLPNRKIISVKSKPSKILTDVLRPILHKYGYKLELVRVLESAQSGKCMNIHLPVTAVDGYRLCIQLEEEAIQENPVQEPPKKLPTAPSLDEITNKVFEEVLQGKAERHQLPQVSDQGSLKSEDWGSEHSSGIFGRLLRRDSATHDKRHKKSFSNMRSKGSSAHGSAEDIGSDSSTKKHLIAKWKAGVKLHVVNKCSESDELYEGLKRAQRSRLEDQRGTEINFELPDFLKDKENAKYGVRKFRKQQRVPESLIPHQNTRFCDHSDILSNRSGEQFSVPKHSKCSIENEETDNFDKSKNSNFHSPSKWSTTDDSPSKSSSCSNLSSKTGHSSLDCTTIENVTTIHFENDLNNSQMETTRNLSTKNTTHSPDISEPPPLPPKPKVLPIKPSNWKKFTPVSTKQNDPRTKTTLYLDPPTSSFV